MTSITELTEKYPDNQNLMHLDPEGKLTVVLRGVDGQRLVSLQKTVLLAIEEVGL